MTTTKPKTKVTTRDLYAAFAARAIPAQIITQIQKQIKLLGSSLAKVNDTGLFDRTILQLPKYAELPECGSNALFGNNGEKVWLGRSITDDHRDGSPYCDAWLIDLPGVLRPRLEFSFCVSRLQQYDPHAWQKGFHLFTNASGQSRMFTWQEYLLKHPNDYLLVLYGLSYLQGALATLITERV